ncbi:terpene synthase family protein [Aspergillus brunneoviolaceus CBS 621.78]|uniref:Uncharacterized protein n=1 Tax=Aspergillus brunneoviolaceus CBS 621.78 TaxID=1450534 RepID=A0ACD1FZ27_9EURO|nr:hypothetical protein BO95DRAFT_435186 [Aspergillus brunneoviolaceus CBS 621.78]RAH42166.1 hypothetical protein BO95DRAFT_435186 [Aspergillus brunneoviolaceus CBS 621.78]
MAVRTKTIGIGPFMTMAIWGILGRKIEHKELNALMDKIKHVVGLQNDLIGLEKDIRSGECMNSVLILARSGQVGDVVNEQKTILARAQRVYEMHNQLVIEAVEIARNFLSRPIIDMTSEEKVAAMETILLVAQHHLHRSTSAKRYDVVDQ